MTARAPMPPDDGISPPGASFAHFGLAAAGRRTVACWSALIAGGALADEIGPELALLLSLSAAGGLASWRAPRTADERRPAAAALVLGLLAGIGTYPAWAGAIAVAGLALGLPADAARAAPPTGAAGIAAVVVAAPLFEERLYRGVVLGALHAMRPDAGGAALAVLGSSALFALPHLAPWAVLGTFLVGLALGITRLAGGSLALCVAVHAGLNVAALLARPVAPAAAALAAAAWVAAVASARRRPLARPRSGGSCARGV